MRYDAPDPGHFEAQPGTMVSQPLPRGPFLLAVRLGVLTEACQRVISSGKPTSHPLWRRPRAARGSQRGRPADNLRPGLHPRIQDQLEVEVTVGFASSIEAPEALA